MLAISVVAIGYITQRDVRAWRRRCQRVQRQDATTNDVFEVKFGPTIILADRSTLPKERLTDLDAQKVSSPVVGRLLGGARFLSANDANVSEPLP